MRALAVTAEQDEHLGGPADAAHPVRRPRAELGRLSRFEDEVVVSEHEPEPAAEHVQPLVAVMAARVRRSALGQREVVGARATGARAAERHDAHAVDGSRPSADARIDPRLGGQQRVDGGAEGAGQRREVVDREATLAGLEPAERRRRHVRGGRHRVEGEPPLLAQRAHPPSDPVLVPCHFSKRACQIYRHAVTLAGMETDVVVVGGGSAGLQAALTLGRMRFDVVVVDAGRPSNAPAHHIGGLLGAHDVGPLDLLSTGRAQLSELPSVQLVAGEATRVDADRTVTLADGTTLTADAVVLATGMDYAVPDVPGMAELWGTSVIHCPFCHGWEVRDRRVGLLAVDENHAGHLVPMLSRLTADLEVFDAVAAVRPADGAVDVVLPDGSEVARDALFVAAPPTPRDAAFAHLALARRESGQLEVDDFGRTSAPGIYAAGDLVVTAQAVVQALASGQRAAVGVTRDLAAVTARST
jgi:thioredoxin reductase